MDATVERVTAASAPGSTIAVDSALLRTTRASISPELLELWQGGPDVDLDTWFTRRGWHPAVQHANELWKDGFLVNAAAPATSLRTATTAPGTSPAQGAGIVVRLATLGADGPTAGFFSANGPVPW